MRTESRSVLVLAAAAALTLVGPQPAPSLATSAVTSAGPGDRVSAAVRTGAPAARIVRPASLTRTATGYSYSSWGQDNRLVVTLEEGRLHFRDPRAVRWDRLARSCSDLPVDVGVAASCRVPAGVSVADPLTIAMELRLGDDVVDTTTLGPQFQASVLADAGNDVLKLGLGADFVNGAFDRDRIWAGGGDDFVRTGEGNDVAHGETGNDHLSGTQASDVLRGGVGNDLVEGGPGNDEIYGDEGDDRLKCGDGSDAADIDPADSQRLACERSTG